MYIRENVQSKKIKKLVAAGAVIFVACTIIYFLSHLAQYILPLKITIIEGVFIITYCLYFFYELLTTTPDKEPLKQPSFWSISGMLVLFGTITPFFLFYDLLLEKHNHLAQNLFFINNIAYSLLFATFAIAIFVDRKRPATK